MPEKPTDDSTSELAEVIKAVQREEREENAADMLREQAVIDQAATVLSRSSDEPGPDTD